MQCKTVDKVAWFSRLVHYLTTIDDIKRRSWWQDESTDGMVLRPYWSTCGTESKTDCTTMTTAVQASQVRAPETLLELPLSSRLDSIEREKQDRHPNMKPGLDWFCRSCQEQGHKEHPSERSGVTSTMNPSRFPELHRIPAPRFESTAVLSVSPAQSSSKQALILCASLKRWSILHIRRCR